MRLFSKPKRPPLDRVESDALAAPGREDVIRSSHGHVCTPGASRCAKDSPANLVVEDLPALAAGHHDEHRSPTPVELDQRVDQLAIRVSGEQRGAEQRKQGFGRARHPPAPPPVTREQPKPRCAGEHRFSRRQRDVPEGVKQLELHGDHASHQRRVGRSQEIGRAHV